MNTVERRRLPRAWMRDEDMWVGGRRMSHLLLSSFTKLLAGWWFVFHKLPKMSFFAWEATRVEVLTLDQLQRIKWSLANMCSFWLKEEESLWQESCYMTSSLYLRCLGFYPPRWGVCYQVGMGPWWVGEKKGLVGCSSVSFSGQSGMKEMLGFFMIKANLNRHSSKLFFVTFGLGQICLEFWEFTSL